MFPVNLLEITERTDERMVIRTRRFYAYAWALLMPCAYIVGFGILLILPLVRGEEPGREYWHTLVLASVFIPLGLVYSLFICRKLNVVTLDRWAGKLSVRPFLRLPLMRPPASRDLREVSLLFFARSLQWQQCLYISLQDGMCIPLLDGNGHFRLKRLRQAGRLHEEIAVFAGAPYVNAFEGGSPYGFVKLGLKSGPGRF